MVFLFVFLGFLHVVATGDIGTFLHVTDFHFDPAYVPGGNREKNCHSFTDGSQDPTVGIYGDFGYCDSPFILVESSIQAMSAMVERPDFILWTGDTGPHIHDADTNATQVVQSIAEVTRLFRRIFPNVPLYPTWGNHDFWPRNYLPDTSNAIFNTTIELWKSGIWPFSNSKLPDTIIKAGYYSKQVLPDRKLMLLALNSNMWSPKDAFIFTNPRDPGNQFHWLKNELQAARNASYKVIIAGHIPPGFDANWGPGYRSEYNELFLTITGAYSDVISAMFFGHWHTDTFRVVPNLGSGPSIPLLSAPAITSWGGNNNPGFRMIKYDRNSGQVADVIQYSMDLTRANQMKTGNWQQEYSYSSLYGLKNVTGLGLSAILNRFQKNDTLFQQYFKYFSVGHTQSLCTGHCRLLHWCALNKLKHADYYKCIAPLLSTVPTKKTTKGSDKAIPLLILSILTAVYVVIHRWAAYYWLLLAFCRMSGSTHFLPPIRRI